MQFNSLYRTGKRNTVNPILSTLRDNIKGTRVGSRFEVVRMLYWVEKSSRMGESGWVTRDEEQHAWRVLKRLEKLHE